MKKKKIIVNENYLERIPLRVASIKWTKDDEKVTLEIENTGWANRIAQIFFKRPKVSYVHLDEMGSFLWPILDGERDITAIGELVKEKFGEAAEPLYPRLAKFFHILESYHFISWKNK